jgi:anti-sigma regulatory factor (Ser/Thr protein kinase)
MTASPWAHRAPPIRHTESSTVGRWRPGTPTELTASRRQLSAALHDGARPAATAEDAVQRLLLAFEELASNALRHGRLPVEVTVTRTGRSWLLEISDAAADREPTPAVDRDPALGGLGLPLVATICAAHGWTVEGGRKVVWARVDYTRAEASEASEAPLVPRPRGTSSGHSPMH